MSDVDQVVLDQAPAVVGRAATKPLLHRVNSWIRTYSDRFLNLWSALTIVVVACIFILCGSLWQFESLRPILATAGAGLAAFLGPIPGIISAEARSKWLVTIFVSALIAAGTWFATQDLADQVRARDADLAQMSKRLDTHKEFTITLLGLTHGEAQDAVFVQAALLLKELQLAGQYKSVIDLAMPMLRLRPGNGAALAFVGYAYRGLGDMPEAKRRLQNYLAEAANVSDAQDGPQRKCYDRADGFCAERTGWIEHLVAAIALRQAQSAQSTDEQAERYEEAYEHEAKNLRLMKWPDKAFQDFKVEPEEALSSCMVLQGVIDGLKSIGRSATKAIELRRTKAACG